MAKLAFGQDSGGRSVLVVVTGLEGDDSLAACEHGLDLQRHR
jgi:hypothetical protein